MTDSNQENTIQTQPSQPLVPGAKTATQEMNATLPEWLEMTKEEVSDQMRQERRAQKADGLNQLLGEGAPDWLRYNPDDESVKNLVDSEILSEIASINAKKQARADKILKVLGPSDPIPPGKKQM